MAKLDTDPPSVVNTTSTSSAVFLGLTTVTVLTSNTVTEVPAMSPNITDVVPLKLVPVIVTIVPPLFGPLRGAISEIVGTEI